MTVRLAFFSPLPPARSGVADYAGELLPHLGKLSELTLFASEPEQVDPAIRRQFPVYPLGDYPQRRWQYDVALYQMGNSRHHAALYHMMRRYPGILMLHDLVLHHFIADETVGQGNYAAYVRELAYEGGLDGAELAWAIQQGLAQHPLTTMPLNQRLVDLSLGVLVHSNYLRQKLENAPQKRPVYVVPHFVPAAGTSDSSKEQLQRLPWPEEALIYGSFGQVTSAKRLDQALRAFAQLRETAPQARYLIVGEVLPEVPMQQIVDDLNLRDAVLSLGFAEGLQDFLRWMATADVVVNLRLPTLGETSGPALRALAAGKPLIVYEHGWYAELPDEATLKVPPGNEAALLEAMKRLAASPERRRQMGEQGQAFAAQHSAEKMATAYVEAVERILDELTERSTRA